MIPKELAITCGWRLFFWVQLIFVLFMIKSVWMADLSAQICEGNLGENIFTDGDFGTGSINIPTTDPQIAPGYMYTTQGPPNDGFYTLTNDIALWPTDFGWMNITDNSEDPEGYMMVVNASYDPGLFYEQEVEGLCENTLYEFSVDVFNLIWGGTNLILPNVSFLIDNDLIFDTGDIPESGQWTTYGFTFTTAPGQTTVTLSLQNNAPGGIGNDIAMDNIAFRACGPEALILPTEIANICEDGAPIDLEATINGEQFDTPALQWQQSFDEGLTWEDIPGENNLTYTHTNLSAGYYYYRYLIANGPANLANLKCYIVSNVKIIYVIPKFYAITDTLCEGLAFSLGENNFTETGTYIDSLLTKIGCDSIVTLDLTIVPDNGIEANFNSVNPTCSYLLDGEIAMSDIQNGNEPYAVFFNGGPIPSSYEISGLGGGDYIYEIVDQYGCRFDTTIALGNPNPFTIDLGEDQETSLGNPIEIKATANETVSQYNWYYLPLSEGINIEPGNEPIECPADCSVVELLPLNSTFVTLTALSEKNCAAYDTVFIKVDKIREVAIPSAFSPNGDGLNDFFTVFGNAVTIEEVEELLVFNRWGEMLYQEQNLSPNERTRGWDGTSKGKEQNMGVYIYLAQIRFLDGEVIIYSGDITLVR